MENVRLFDFEGKRGEILISWRIKRDYFGQLQDKNEYLEDKECNSIKMVT